MTRHTGKSNLWKVALTLLAVVLCVSLTVGVFAFAADGDTTATPVEIIGLVADSNYYTFKDGYWRTDGGTGDYAFYQGMNINDALDRITGVEVKMDDETTDVLPINDDVTITPLTRETGNSFVDNEIISFDVEVTSDGESLTKICDLNFIANKPYALEWVSGAPDTTGKGLYASQSLVDLSKIGISDGVLRFRLTSGRPGDPVMARDLVAVDSLAPTGDQIAEIIEQGEDAKYDKTITIAYKGDESVVYSQTATVKFLVRDIEYIDPDAIVSTILGTAVAQSTKTTFNFEGLQIRLNYDGDPADIALTDLPDDYIKNVKFLDANSARANVIGEGKDFLLTTAVKAVSFTVEIPTRTGSVSSTLRVGCNVDQYVLPQAGVSDLNPTYEEGGVTVTLSDVLEDEDNPIQMSVSGGTIVANAITFDKGGTYTLTLTLTKGAAGDYVWAIVGDGQRDDNNHYVLTYTIVVSNAPVDVTLTYTNGADRQYGDGEPAHTVALSYTGVEGDAGKISDALTKGSAQDDPSNSGLPNCELRYYPASGTTLATPDSEVIDGVTVNYTTVRPTALGDYYVYAATGATDKYAAGRSKAVKFTISQRKLYATDLVTSVVYDGKAHTVDDFVNIGATRPDGSPMFVYGDKVEDVITIPETTFIHVSDSQPIEITIANDNYIWSDNSSKASVNIVIEKCTDLNFEVSPHTLNYGDRLKNKPPVVNTTTSDLGVLKFGVVIDPTRTKYEKQNIDETWSVISVGNNPYNETDNPDGQDHTGEIWNAGKYRVTYYTKTAEGQEAYGGEDETGEPKKDYNLPEVTAEFEIKHRVIDKVSIDASYGVLRSGYGTIGIYSYYTHDIYITNWLTNNVSPQGDAILTVMVRGTRSDNSSVPGSTVTNDQDGKISLTQAGKYIIEIKLNSNYKYKATADEADRNETLCYYGTIEKRVISDVALSSEGTTYDGANHTARVEFKFTATGTSSWKTDSLNDGANILNIVSITGSKHAAAVLATSVTPNETDGVQNGYFTVKYAGEYKVALALNDSLNYKWADDAKQTLTYTVEQARYQGAYDYTGHYTFVVGMDKQDEPNFTMTKIAENDTAAADVTAITPTFTLYDIDGNVLDKITEAGTFYKVVTSITSADSEYLNYYLPEENKDTSPRYVSVEFVINSAGLDKIVLVAGDTGATINGNNIAVTYKHGAYKFSDFVDNWSKYYYAAGNIPYLDITVDGGNIYNPELTDVKIESGAVVSYVVTVKPATNYEWKEDEYDSVDQELTFRITIKQLAVELEWNNTSKDYSDNATTTVSVTNAEAGYDVSVDYVYVNGSSAEIATTAIANANAGNYTLLAKSLTGADAANYTLIGGTNVSGTAYTIYKKGIAKPLTNATATTSVGTYNDGNTASLYSNQGALQSGLFSVAITGYYPSAWFGDGTANKSFDVSASVFNKATGVFSYNSAGYYSFVFSIDDAANYCWADEYNAEKDAFTTNAYTHSWTDLVVVARGTAMAPSLDKYRAMEWDKGVADLKEKVFFEPYPCLTYDVMFVDCIGEKKYGEPVSEQKGGIGEKENITRGKYAALLTMTGDNRYNYIWIFDKTDTDGMSYVDYGGYYSIYTNEGAQIYLHYTITASQLPISYEVVSGYVFGANGVDNSIAVNQVLKMVGDDADIAIATAEGVQITYTYTAHEDNSGLTVLKVNDLPWYAGKYYVSVKIDFSQSEEYKDVYSELTVAMTGDGEQLVLVVAPRVIEVEWSFGDGDDKQTGASLTSIYNNADQTVNAVITNMPKMSADDETVAPTLTLKYNGSATSPKNAATYNVVIDEITGDGAGNFTKTGCDNLTCTFVINPHEVTVTATEVSGHIYGNAVADAEKAFTVTSVNQFFGTDANGIKVQIWNAGLTAQYVNTNDVGTYKVVPTWNGTKPTETDGAYVINAGNYTITVVLADFTVVEREITVTFNAANATSVYGDTVNLYSTEAPIYNVSWTNAVDQDAANWLVGSVNVTSVFTLSSDATTAYANVGHYDVNLTKASSNYIINVGTETVSDEAVKLGEYVITKADITISKAEGYTGVYDGNVHNMFTLAATAVNNQTLSWYYQDISTTDNTLWTAYDVSDPATVKNVLDSGVYHIKVEAPNHNADYAEVAVTINKATIKVQIALSIWYGEKDPANYNGEGDAFKATIAELTSNADMYKFTGLVNGETIDVIFATGAFAYTTTYVQGDAANGKAGTYGITFVNDETDPLTAPNYTFANAANEGGATLGVLTVNKLALTVSVDNLSTEYYSVTYFSALFKGKVHVELPKSTYDSSKTLDADDLGVVYNTIYNADNAFEGSTLLNVTTEAFDGNNTGANTKAVGTSYVVTVTLKSTVTNYTANTATATHSITATNLAVNNGGISGYNGTYNGEDNDMIIAAENGNFANGEYAKAKGGNAVTVSYFVADGALTNEELAAAAWTGTMPTVIDVCSKVVYVRIQAANHNDVYINRNVVVTKATNNVFTTDFAVANATWIYGIKNSVNKSTGADSDVTDGEALYSRLVVDGNVAVNNFVITLYKVNADNDKTQLLVDKQYTSATELFKDAWLAGTFVAGKYELSIVLNGTDNYNGLEASIEIVVNKAELTVTAKTPTALTYGDDAPEFYDYDVTGFVTNKVGGAVETKDGILGAILEANKHLFTTTYQAGRLNGSVGTYAVERFVSGTTVIDGLNDVAETDNYTITYVGAELTVNKREVTISIADAVNRYNLSIIVDGKYDTQDAATYEFVLNESSSFFADDVAFEIHTEALTSLTGKRTNNAGKYPIYVRWLSYEDNDKAEVSYSKNYTVKFEDCSYEGELPTEAITQNGVKCAGTYTIEKAELIVNIIGPLNADGKPATNGLVYSNTRKYYKAEVDGGDDDVEFTVAYYNGHSTASKRDDAPIDKGDYRVVVSTDNNNYVAQTTNKDITIIPATVLVGWELIEGSETIVAQIEYGTSITALDATKNYPSNARFTGLTYTYESEYFEHDALITLLNSAITEYNYTTSYTTATTTTSSGNGVRITPSIKGSANFTFTTEYGILQVIQRKVTVQVNGWDNGNPAYATSPYTGKSPFDGTNGSWNNIKSWFNTIEEDAYVNGHSIASLGITLGIDGTTAYDASATAYKVNVTKGTNNVSVNYNVKFVVGDDKDAYPATKPTYLITKKAITLTVKDQTVTYGNTINSNLANGFEVGALNGITFPQYFVFDGMLSSDWGSYRYDASGSENNVYKFAFDYTPYVTNIGDITLSIDKEASTIEFTNYEVTSFVAGKITVKARVISASTADVTYAEVRDGDNNRVYNDGVYGAARTATITYDGHDNGTGYLDTYVPTATLSYSTVTGAGQVAGNAPTKVGNYSVYVTLTNNNYVFDSSNSNVTNNGKTMELGFNVLKRTLNPSWAKPSIQNEEGTEPADLENYVAQYIASIMNIEQFQKTAMDNVVTDIHAGTDADSYQVGTVGSESVGLYITVTATGEYRITLTLTEAAKANYQWGGNASSVTLIFNVATDKVSIIGLAIDGWTYGEAAKEVTFTVSNDNPTGVQITYALIPSDYDPKPASGTALRDWYQGLTYSGSIPTDAGDYAVRAYYPSYSGVNGDEQFVSFTIAKATMATPTLTVTEGNNTFNGEQLSATLTFDTLKVRVYNYTGTSYSVTSTGATIYATDAGSYTVTFRLIDGNNYQWGGNASSETWTIAKADNNEVTFTNSDVEKTVVYGNRITPRADATYDGAVYFRYMAKTSDVEPAQNDTNWLTSISKFVVGEYWVMAVNSGNNNYNGDYAITSFTVTPATLTITPSGSMTYGEVFSNNNSTLNYVISDGCVQSDNPDDIINVTGTITYELVDAPSKLNATTYGIVLKSDENGVIGLSADNYIIVSATGEFVVNKRDVTVTLGTATSQYGRPIVLDDVTKTYGKDELIEGDSLNLVLDTTAKADSVIGGYIITASYDNDNYNVTVIPGTYTITERRITIELVAGGGVYGETIVPIDCGKVLDDENVDITDFVKGKLTLTVIYSGTANDGTECDGTMPTHAGTYLATVKGTDNVNFIIVGEPFTQFAVDKKVLDGSIITIANQTYTELALEPVLNTAAFVAAYGDELYDVLAHADFVNAGTHVVTLRLKDANNYKWKSVEVAEFDLTFTIDKANNELTSNIAILGWIYGEYDSQANLPTATVKFGQGAVTFVYSDSLDGTYHSGAPITGDVGEYYVRVTVPATDNYNAFTSAPVKFAISKKALVIPALTLITDGEGKNDVYSGDELLSTIDGFDMALMNLHYEGKFNVNAGQVVVIAVNAGTYTVTVSIRNTHNYYFANSDEDQVALTWTVAPKAVAKPTENTNRFMVNGQILTYIPEGFDEEIMTIDGNQTAYGGEFTVTVGLKDTANYVWAEGGIDDFTLTWNVIGINTVFYIVVGVLGGASVLSVLAAGLQLLLDRRRRIAIDNAIDERSQAEADKGGKTDKKPQPKNDETNEGGND